MINKWMDNVFNVWMNESLAQWNAWGKKKQLEVSEWVKGCKKIILEKQSHVVQEANSNGLHSQSDGKTMVVFTRRD